MCVLRLRFEGRSGEFVRNMLALSLVNMVLLQQVKLYVVCVCDRQSVCACMPYLHGFDVQTTR